MKATLIARPSFWMALTLVVGTLGVGNPAAADDFESPGVDILETVEDSCPQRGGMCFSPGAFSTQVAPATANQTAGNATRFIRPSSLLGRRAVVEEAVPWTINLNATLRHPALKGNVQFLVFDMEDPKSISSHEVTAMWQVRVPAGNQISARLTLSPDEGFHSGHTYRVRICQIIRNKEVILAEGDVRLM
jgi:hypothetical protein